MPMARPLGETQDASSGLVMIHTNARPETGAHPGDVLAGKYRVERVLGAGGMGVVVAAHHAQLDTKVAIKLLLPQMLSNPEAVARFAREARAAVRITSEHVARVIDVGTLETGAPFMVMEYLEGADLAAWLRERGALPVDQAVEFVLQACVAVAEAHGLGIVHRDLKPSNLFCVRRPDGQLSVKVLDFGISKLGDAGRASEPPGMSVTKTSAVLGSPFYMSPEQMQSAKSADAQSDIWALGIILYELLTGRVPFDGEAATEIALKVSMLPPPPPRSWRADIPPALEAVILKCLEKDRQHRYRNVAELAVPLGEFAPARARACIERITGTIQAAGLSTSARAAPRAPRAPMLVASSGTIAPVGQTTPGHAGGSPRGGLVVGLALAGILVVGGAGVALLRMGAGPRPPTSASASAAVVAVPPLDDPASLAPWPADSTPSTPVEAEAPAPAIPPPPSHPVPRARAASPAPAVRSSPAAAPALSPAAGRSASPDCDPAFTLDDQGRKHFKPECFLNK
jgi:hypothetical protein